MKDTIFIITDKMVTNELTLIAIAPERGFSVTYFGTWIKMCWVISSCSVVVSILFAVVVSTFTGFSTVLTNCLLYVSVFAIVFSVVMDTGTVPDFSTSVEQIVSSWQRIFWEKVHPRGGTNVPSGCLSHSGTWWHVTRSPSGVQVSAVLSSWHRVVLTGVETTSLIITPDGSSFRIS